MEKMKILVLGATGMLGHQVLENLLFEREYYDVVNVSFRNKYNEDTIIADLSNELKVKELIFDIKPDIVVNCVGVLIKGANENITNAIFINSLLPHILVKLCDEINSTLIHISTDCVFSGSKGKYKEKDIKDGFDIYAKTKSLGEVINDKHLTLRTSIIGPELKKEGEGLFHWFSNQKEKIGGFSKAIWSGVTTLELAKVINKAIKQKLRGLYHVTNNESISKFELLKIFNKYTHKEILINEIEGKNVDKSFNDTRKELDHIIPSYDVMIKEMVKNINDNKNRYSYKF